MDRYPLPEQAKRFYDRIGSAQDWQGCGGMELAVP
jgi:hypothetical protein